MTFEIYRLSNGDITVGKGAWVLMRYSRQTGKVRVIDRDAPAHWIAEAREMLDAETKGKGAAMSKHTPGPWQYDPGIKGLGRLVPNGHGLTAIRIEGARCQYVTEIQSHDLNEEDFANARLIAAAPELLEAAERAFANGAIDVESKAGQALARAIAIAKAEGKE